ncbi:MULTISPECIES: STN domain-containing protein [Bradyrhizobium]|uniref:STN domain-containing protein n=1 Tax=Bradyrhizobium elkanii TaxID=29448 RepID=UPI0004129BBD|nr:STN domain-containing protein [Bradyrhizobium elkanii]
MNLVFAKVNQHFMNIVSWWKCVITRDLAVVVAHLMMVLALSHASPAGATSFDIPAQPLASAIDAFCAATGTEVYYDGAAAIGQRSSAVTGALTRDDALRGLLAGTELVPLRARENSYLLIHPGDDAAHAFATARIAQDGQYQRYFAVVQADILRILCRYPDMRPVSYRLVIKLWISSSGLVQHAELDGSAGEQASHRMLLATLGKSRMTEPPPAQMPQPITMVALPGAAADARLCASPVDQKAAR